jgi:hypothetical protein
MLLKQATLAGIETGEITLAFRRWQRPTVRAGGRLRTAIGELAIDAVDEVTETSITEAEARAAGFESRSTLLKELASRPAGTLFRIRLRLAGPDSRIELRENDRLGDAEVAELAERLDRYDATSKVGAWTRAVLRLIEEKPATRAAELAERSGFEMEWLKVNVRKLKNLGLTESLHPGYRLSPRGRAFLERDCAGG